MLKPLDDLQKFYKIGEILYFNAVQAPINSRAKWKATRVWKCSEEDADDTAAKTANQSSPGNRSHDRTASDPSITTSAAANSKFNNNNNNEQSSPAQVCCGQDGVVILIFMVTMGNAYLCSFKKFLYFLLILIDN